MPIVRIPISSPPITWSAPATMLRIPPAVSNPLLLLPLDAICLPLYSMVGSTGFEPVTFGM